MEKVQLTCIYLVLLCTFVAMVSGAGETNVSSTNSTEVVKTKGEFKLTE